MPPRRAKTEPADLASIASQFGLIHLEDEQGAITQIETLDSGSIALNHALGVGGLPKGRVIEIYGPEGSGKTTLALYAIARCQAEGGTAAFIDAEHALSPAYARAIGVDTKELWFSQPDFGEQGLDIATALLRSGEVDIIVIDSVASLTPKAEIEGDIGDSNPGAQARMMSKALRVMTTSMSATSATVIFINQLREKIGILFGSPETTSGGKALKFYSSVRLDVRRVETLKDGTLPVGSRLKVSVVKNKVAPPYGIAYFNLLFGKGIDHEQELLELGENLGLVTRTGNTYHFTEHVLGASRQKAKDALAERSILAEALGKAILLTMEKGSA